MLWLPGSTLSTTTCLVGSGEVASCGGDERGGDELSGSTEPAVSARNRQRGERGLVRGLTARLTEGLAGAGTAGGQRIDAEDLRAPRLKKTSGTALGCFPGCLARRG